MLAIEKAQAIYCETQSRVHRKDSGQFFTPRWIASGMARWVVDCQPEHILDPAVGFGILLDECRQCGYLGKLFGYDIDATIISEWVRGMGDDINAEILHQDFLTTNAEPIAAAIVNPPYNRFQNRTLSKFVQTEINQAVGLSASGYTNQYAIFIYLVVSRLKLGGRAAFIVPSEFLATVYGQQVKNFICRNKRLSHLILFDTAERIFPEATTTACVMLFEGLPCENLQVWNLSGKIQAEKFYAICGGKKNSVAQFCISYNQLNPKNNWQSLGQDGHNNDGMIPLTVFGEVKRGIATGANEFFVLRPSQAKSLSLASENLVDCIASAISSPSPIYDDEQFNKLRIEDKPCYLFNGLGSDSYSAQQYVHYGEALGIDQRYLTRMRKPWYRLESRRPAALLLAVFGRDGFRVCLNRTNAVNLTAFHGFYPHAYMTKWVPLIWLYLQGSMARARYSSQQRAYGDGLKKLEPGDWSNLYIPDWCRWSPEKQNLALGLANNLLAKSNSSIQSGLKEACAELERLILTVELVGNNLSDSASQLCLL
jgi:adenine-specific DNA-methyltransferase